MRIALAQVNPVVGDIEGNLRLALDAVARAEGAGADLVVLPELALIGYPPRDLLLRAGVVDSCEQAIGRLARASGRIAVIAGHTRRGPGRSGRFRNSVSVCAGGRVVSVYDKRLLPGYDVFDEDRWFEPGDGPCVVPIAGRRVGVLLCEDLWRARDAATGRTYEVAPVDETVAAGAEILVALNASPFVQGKPKRHLELLIGIAQSARRPLVSVSQVGANDDLIFDGNSAVIDPDGKPRALLAPWRSDFAVVDLDAPPEAIAPPPPDDVGDAFEALVLGVRDYCVKTGVDRVWLGLSGGVDSALTAVIAAVALGSSSVRGVTMPSRHSSSHSVEDARDLAARLDLPPLLDVAIEPIHAAASGALAAAVGAAAHGVTDENVQARVRGLVLMGLSNAEGGLVLATGNKSELATGYTTLYGDMCGAISVIGDLLKTEVWAMARWANEHYERLGFAQPPIPERTITKPPSAELRPNQCDQDTLPEYETLDLIVRGWVDGEDDVAAIACAAGLDVAFVRSWTDRIDRAQYKREQAAVILKVSPRAFGRGREMPIVLRTPAAGS